MNLEKFRGVKNLLLVNQNTKQTIFKNAFWLLITEAISKALVAILVVLIARYLGVENYGKFNFAFAYVALFGIIGDFGLNNLVIRELSRNRNSGKKYLGNTVLIKLVLNFITIVAIIIFVQLLDKSPEVKILAYLAGIWTVLQGLIVFFQSIFRSFEKMEYEALSKIIYYFALFFFCLLAIFGRFGIRALFYSYILAAFISLFVTLIVVRKKITHFYLEIDFKFWRKILKKTVFFASIGVFTVIYLRANIVMLSILKGDEAVGWYVASYNIIFMILVGVGLLNSTLFPALSVRHKQLYKLKKEILWYVIGLILLALLTIFVSFKFGGEIIDILYGSNFSQSKNLLKTLSLSTLFLFPNTFLGVLLLVANEEKMAAVIIAGCAIVNILLNIFMIPFYSANGVAISIIITEALGFIAQLAYLQYVYVKNS